MLFISNIYTRRNEYGLDTQLLRHVLTTQPKSAVRAMTLNSLYCSSPMWKAADYRLMVPTKGNFVHV